MNPENQNTLKSWVTGKLAMFTIGLLAGYAVYQMGLLQKISQKLFKKKDTKISSQEEY